MKPERRSYTRTISIESGDTFEKISGILETMGVKPSEATFRQREVNKYDRCCDYGSFYQDTELAYEEPESDKRWEAILASYRKRLASWEEWAENHKEEIAARLAEEVEEKKVRLTRLAERSRNSLEKERKTLEKRLGNLERRLQK